MCVFFFFKSRGRGGWLRSCGGILGTGLGLFFSADLVLLLGFKGSEQGWVSSGCGDLRVEI